MPIYEYRRPDGTTFDVIQKFSDDTLTVDPESGVPVEKVLHAPAIHFKGTGFHNTDYGTRRRNKELERSASDGADKTESKSAEKASADSSSSSSNTKSSGDSSSSSSSSSSSDGTSAKQDSAKAKAA